MQKKHPLRNQRFSLVAHDMDQALDALMMTSEKHKLGLIRMSRQQGSIPMDGNIELEPHHTQKNHFVLKIQHGRKTVMAPGMLASRVQQNIFKLEKEKNR